VRKWTGKCSAAAVWPDRYAAAYLLNADEIITTEKPGKATHKNTLVPVVYLGG
jgi:hypothetical protein